MATNDEVRANLLTVLGKITGTLAEANIDDRLDFNKLELGSRAVSHLATALAALPPEGGGTVRLPR